MNVCTVLYAILMTLKEVKEFALKFLIIINHSMIKTDNTQAKVNGLEAK